jgi:hypothetical protein
MGHHLLLLRRKTHGPEIEFPFSLSSDSKQELLQELEGVFTLNRPVKSVVSHYLLRGTLQRFFYYTTEE